MFDLSIKAKSYIVIILMIGCFSLLYPKIFHPMLLNMVGLRAVEPAKNDFIHPRDRPVAIKSSEKHHQHPGHHPGRVVSDKQGQSGRGGVMTMILPVYAIGIVFYLLYTLIKVFGGSKENKKVKQGSILKNYYRDFHYDPNIGDFKLHHNNSEQDGQTVDDVSGDLSYRYRPTEDIYNTARTLPHDLEHLLQKVDERNINENEMHQLKIRLEETESQLTKILMAMEQLEGKSRVEDIPEKLIKSVDLSNASNATEVFQDCEEGDSNEEVKVVHRKSAVKADIQ